MLVRALLDIPTKIYEREFMNGRISGAAFGALALVTPLIAHAQATPTYYVPPKLATHGTNTSAIAGKGIVVVQVLVNKNRSFKVIKILHSTNKGDNAAALEIARKSTYRPASRGAQKLTAYYDYTLRFTAAGAASADEGSGAGAGGGGTASAGSASAGGAGRFEAMLHAGNYSAAQAGLRSYVAQHPNDARGQSDLGVADTFLSDYAGAVDAFDKAGTIGPSFKSVAVKAYSEETNSLLKDNQADKAIAVGKRATELAPSAVAYNDLGNAELQVGQNTAAVTDLEKARTLAGSTPDIKPKAHAQIDANLVAAYLATNDVQKAKAVAAEATQLDPSQSGGAGNIFANYYSKQAQTLSKAGKNGDAAAMLEQAAASAPRQAAVQLYAEAAFNYLQAQPKPENDKAKADADKALALAPDDAQANFAEGIAFANSGKSTDALTYLNKADAAAKKDNDTKLATAIENAIKQLPSK